MEKRYLLIGVGGREIDATRYETLKEAQEKMQMGIAISRGFKTFEELQKADPSGDEYDWGCCTMSAFSNEGINHSDWDWEIIDLEKGDC